MLREIFQGPNFNIKNYAGNSEAGNQSLKIHDISVSNLYPQATHLSTHETIRNVTFTLDGRKQQILDLNLAENL